jgi:lipopolysaccharide biosynthesis glycosyltransferase
MALLSSVASLLSFLLYICVFKHVSYKLEWNQEKMWKYKYQDNEIDQAIYKSSDSSASNPPTIHIFIPSPSNQIIGMMALMNSIYMNTNAKLKFHLLTDTQAGADHITGWLKNSSTLCKIDKDIIVFNSSWIMSKFKVPDWESRKTAFNKPLPFARYFIPRFLPPDFKGRVVYMDDDIIVQGDIRDLAWTRMAEHHFAALSPDCNDVTRAFHLKTVTYNSYLNFENSHLKRIKIPHEACKLNSGVIVVDIDKWRKWNITEKLLYWTELNKE